MTTIHVAHSPDSDDAFMFYALASGKVDTETRKYEHVLRDIQTLNDEAKKGTYDVTALSFHAYPYVRRNCCIALGRLGSQGKSAVPALARALEVVPGALPVIVGPNAKAVR